MAFWSYSFKSHQTGDAQKAVQRWLLPVLGACGSVCLLHTTVHQTDSASSTTILTWPLWTSSSRLPMWSMATSLYHLLKLKPLESFAVPPFLSPPNAIHKETSWQYFQSILHWTTFDPLHCLHPGVSAQHFFLGYWSGLLTWTSLVAQMVKCLPTVWETWVQSLGGEDLLEKEMATHSSILAWRIPWMEDPGRLQSMGSQRVRHDWATLLLWFNLSLCFHQSPLDSSLSSQRRPFQAEIRKCHLLAPSPPPAPPPPPPPSPSQSPAWPGKPCTVCSPHPSLPPRVTSPPSPTSLPACSARSRCLSLLRAGLRPCSGLWVAAVVVQSS